MFLKSPILLAAGAATASVFYAYRKLVSNTSSDSDYESKDSEPKFYQTMLRVPRGALGMILGRRGRTANEIHKETGAFASVCTYDEAEIRRLRSREHEYSQWVQHDEEDDWLEEKPEEDNKASQFGFVKIQAVELAVLKIRGIVNDWQRSRIVEIMRIPREAIKWVIGKNGRQIKDIGIMCRVRTHTVGSEGDNELLEIRGTEEGVAAAMDRIQAAISRFYRNNNMDVDENENSLQGPTTSSGLYSDINAEVEDMAKLRAILEAGDEEW